MKMNAEFATICLKDSRAIKLTDARGSRVACLAGVLWITQEHDVRDVVLHAGQDFVISRQGVTLVHACEDSELSVSVRSPAKHTAGRLTGFGASGWLRVTLQRWLDRASCLAEDAPGRPIAHPHRR